MTNWYDNLMQMISVFLDVIRLYKFELGFAFIFCIMWIGMLSLYFEGVKKQKINENWERRYAFLLEQIRSQHMRHTVEIVELQKESRELENIIKKQKEILETSVSNGFVHLQDESLIYFR